MQGKRRVLELTTLRLGLNFFWRGGAPFGHTNHTSEHVVCQQWCFVSSKFVKLTGNSNRQNPGPKEMTKSSITCFHWNKTGATFQFISENFSLSFAPKKKFETAKREKENSIWLHVREKSLTFCFCRVVFAKFFVSCFRCRMRWGMQLSPVRFYHPWFVRVRDGAWKTSWRDESPALVTKRTTLNVLSTSQNLNWNFLTKVARNWFSLKTLWNSTRFTSLADFKFRLGS